MLSDLDIAAISVSLGLFAGYHIFSYVTYVVKSEGSSSSIQLRKNVANAFLWLKKHKIKDDAPNVTLAIQTLRNTILVAIFLGGGSFTAAYSLLDSLDHSTYADDTAKFVRDIIVSILLFASFICWASVIRACSHLGYLVGTVEFKAKAHLGDSDLSASVSSSMNENTDLNDDVDIDIPNEMRGLISMMLLCFNLGFRFMFISIAFQFYVGGPIALLIATAVMLTFFLILDYSGPAVLTKPRRVSDRSCC